VPHENAAEAAVVEGVHVYGASSRSQVVHFLRGGHRPGAGATHERLARGRIGRTGPGFRGDQGQQHVKRAVEVAAAGGHNIPTFGPIPAGTCPNFAFPLSPPNK
jgi:magnesium chelatase family protein